MSQIIGLQYVFSNVEKEQSPFGLDGFQTLFCSKQLGSEEIGLEKRSKYITNIDNPIKWEYFRLDSGKYVISRTIPLEMTDKFGRTGRFLNHCIVFSEDDWNKVGCNPFKIIDHCHFFSSVEEAINSGNFENGDIEPIYLNSKNLNNPPLKIANGWRIELLNDLVNLAISAPEIVKERRASFILGEPDQALEVLRMLFAIIPPSLRGVSSFNTYSDKVEPVMRPVWAGFIDLSTVRDKIMVQPGMIAFPPKGSLYDCPINRWWQKEVTSRKFEALPELFEYAELLSKIIQGKNQVDIQWNQINREFLISFGAANKELFAKALTEAWGKLKLSNNSLSALLYFLESKPDLTWKIVNQESDSLEILIKTLCGFYPNIPAKVDKERYLQTLHEIAQVTKNRELNYVSNAYELNYEKPAEFRNFFNYILQRLKKQQRPIKYISAHSAGRKTIKNV